MLKMSTFNETLSVIQFLISSLVGTEFESSNFFPFAETIPIMPAFRSMLRL